MYYEALLDRSVEFITLVLAGQGSTGEAQDLRSLCLFYFDQLTQSEKEQAIMAVRDLRRQMEAER